MMTLLVLLLCVGQIMAVIGASNVNFDRDSLKDLKSDIRDKLEGVAPGALSWGSKKIHEAMDTGVPTKLGYGFLMGYSSGYCVKKVSKMIAFVVGGFFIGVQTLAYNGYAAINQEAIRDEVDHLLDLNRDGIVDAKDAKLAYVIVRGLIC